MDFTHFNPQSQKEEDFLANFVARRGVLDFFLRQLRLLEPSRPATHHLIVAPRGYGKTSLLRRIAIAIRTEPDLSSRLIALSFREEQHNVISLDVFWRNCLQSLLEVREDEKAEDEEIEALDAAWERHLPRQALKRDDQDGEPAKQAFNKHCERLDRRPLLLIDNLDSLLAGLPENHQWSLRNDLQSAGGPILIAAASRYPESTHDHQAAFYDFFRIQTLDKLDDKEVMHCLRVRAENRGEAGKKVLDLIADNPGRVAALNTLAGGNPRTLGVLYSVLESHASADVLSQLSAMLDTFTGWYQARTEELPIQSRAVFDALALNWDPMTSAMLGEATGLDTTVVSSQLSRLEKAGYVETVSLSGRKKGRNGYQVSERFFNIWYLMRNGPRRARQSIKFLAVFLQTCFSPRERHSIARAVLQDGHADPGYTLALASGMRQSHLRNQLIAHADLQCRRLGSVEEYDAAIQDLRSIDADRKIAPETEQATSPAESIEELDRTIARLSGSSKLASRLELARALFNKGVRLGEIGKLEDEIEVYDNLVERFGKATEVELREPVAMALFNKGIILGELGKSEDEIKVYDDVVERFGEASEAVLLELVAKVLVNKGIRLGQLGKSEGAIKVYDDVFEHFSAATEVVLLEQVAKALVNKGVTLGECGKSENAIKIYDDVVERFGAASDTALREQVAWALVNKGITLGECGKSENAIKIYDDVVERFGEATEVVLLEPVSTALFIKGVTLGELGKPEDEIKVYDDLVERFGAATEAAFYQPVAQALVNKGIRLSELGQAEEAIKVYDGVVERFGEVTETALREPVAWALANKGFSLGQLGKLEEEIKVYDKVVERFGAATEVALREPVAKALVNKGFRLGQLGKLEEAIKVCDDLVERFGATMEVTLLEQIAWALVNKGIRLGELGKMGEAIKVYDDVVERFGATMEVTLLEQVVWALVNKGSRLGQLGQAEDAIKVYDDVVERFGSATEAALLEPVAVVLNSLGNLFLDKQGAPTKALQAFEDGLAKTPSPESRQMLHANYAYALALHTENIPMALAQVGHALAYENGISLSGRDLLQALNTLGEPQLTRWQSMFDHIGAAVEREDELLWTDYLDDLQRLLWYVVVHGQGKALRHTMEARQYPMKFAPLYHALVAAIDGEDHLLKINPETRQAAMRIYEGLARRLKLYPRPT